MTEKQKEKLLQEVKRLHDRYVLSSQLGPDTFEPGMMEYLDQSDGVIDFETGRYKDFGMIYKQFSPDGNWLLDEHPDTKVKWRELTVPKWDYVKEQIFTVCQHISSLDYLGFDVVITEEGMKILEINTLPAVGYSQIMCGPALSDPKIKAFYEHKGLRKFNGADFYQAYVDSIE